MQRRAPRARRFPRAQSMLCEFITQGALSRIMSRNGSNNGEPATFAGFTLDLADARLAGPDGPVQVGNKALRVLAALVDAEGRLLTKDALFEQAWDGLVVSDAALTSVIKELRRALGDDPRAPRFIESVYGKGYRFVAEVSRAAPSRPVLPDVPPAAGNLPAEDTPLIGRTVELAAVDATLAEPGALVTILGPGGAGKTRLAVAAARRGAWVDGAWFVDLAGISNPRDIAYRVIGAFGFVLDAEGETLPALTARLRRRQCLLVLDNCEQFVARIADLVRAIRREAPGVTLLATSQVALGVPGEQVVALDGLDQAAAAALFLSRARQADARFSVAGSDHLVDRICARLDRLPLAIEMAAARAPALGCEGLLERLDAQVDRRFAVLTRGAPDAAPRHQTLRATLAWSHGLLGETEVQVFRRIAAFGGAFPLDAAVAVTGLGQDLLDEIEVLDALDALVARSLLTARAAPRGGHGRRYALLETMRAFAAERLEEAGETHAARRAHAQWYATAAEPIWADFCGDVSDGELERRHREAMANVFAAARWCYGPGDEPELGHLLVARSAALWSDRLLHRRLDEALGRIGPRTPPAVRARLLGSRAHVLMRLRPLEAVRYADEAVIASRATTNDPWTLIDVLASKGFALWAIGRVAEAAAVAEEIAALLPEGVPSRIAALGIGLIACTTLSREGLDAARPIFARAVAMLRAIGANGLATFWAATALRFETAAPLDRQIEDWRALLAGIAPDDMYADALKAAAKVELVSRLAMRGEPADLAEARVLAGRAFRLGAIASEYRVFVASALIALREGRAEDGARLLGYARERRGSSGDTAVDEPAFAAAEALLATALSPETARLFEGLGARMDDAAATALATAEPTHHPLAGAAA